MKKIFVAALFLLRSIVGLNVVAQQNSESNTTIADASITQSIQAHVEKPATPVDESTLWQSNSLTGKWFGIRPSLEEKGITISGGYTADYFSLARSTSGRSNDYLYKADLVTTIDLETALGWNGAAFSIDIMKTGGTLPGERAAVAQGVSNLEAYDNLSIYTATIEQSFFDKKLSFMAGLYEFCTDFYCSKTTRAFINPAFGLAWDIAQSGKNGPSTFPNASLGLRVKWVFAEQFYFQTAILDGVPGGPNQPAGTHILIRSEDGLFLVTEAGFIQDGDQAGNLYSKLALGLWTYTASFDGIANIDGNASPVQRSDNRGLYLLAEKSLYHSSSDVTVFGRIGFANQHLNRFDYTIAGGFTIKCLFAENDEFGLAFSTAHNGNVYAVQNFNQGILLSESETVLEATYSYVLTPWFTIQPDVQLFVNPGTQDNTPPAVLIGTRFVLTF
jgi:porin